VEAQSSETGILHISFQSAGIYWLPGRDDFVLQKELNLHILVDQ